jgi:hypothetical protein
VDKRGIKDGVHTPSHYEAQRLLGAIFNNNRKKQGRGNHPHADNMVKHHIHIQVIQKLECTEDQGTSDSSSGLLVNIK